MKNRKIKHVGFASCAIAITFFSLVLPSCVPKIFRPISVFGENVRFKPDPHDPDVMIFQNPSLHAAGYTKFLIDPVQIISNDPSDPGPCPEEEIWAEEFQRGLMDIIQRNYSVVDQPGSDVLRVRTAILDIQPTHLELDEERCVVLKLDTFLARVTMELDLSDSVSGERAATLIHRLRGEKYMDKDKQTRLLNIQMAFMEWMEELGERFNRSKINKDRSFEGLDVEEHRKLKFQEGE